MVSIRTKEDHELVKRAVLGDQRAYTLLMNRHKAFVHKVVFDMVRNPDDTDDLTMEAFGKAFTNLNSYKPDFAFSTWLHRIAKNHCIDFIRKRKKIVFDSTHARSHYELDEETDLRDDGYQFVATDTNPEESYIKEQRHKLMGGLIFKLKPTYRKLIEMRHFDGLSYEEIAADMELSVGTVKAKVFRAKEILAHLLRNIKNRY